MTKSDIKKSDEDKHEPALCAVDGWLMEQPIEVLIGDRDGRVIVIEGRDVVELESC